MIKLEEIDPSIHAIFDGECEEPDFILKCDQCKQILTIDMVDGNDGNRIIKPCAGCGHDYFKKFVVNN